MTYFYNLNIKISGIASAVPKNAVDIRSYEKRFGKDDVMRFMNNIGIKKVHRTLPMQTASDLGYEAAENLLKNLNIKRDNIGILIFVSQSPDYRKPATACVLQKRLNLSTTCAAFDVNLGCSAFVYCNQIMRSLLSVSDAQYGLLILGETSSKLVSPEDESTVMMFGDAGSAVLYEKTTHTLDDTLLMSDGNRFKSIIVPAGGFRDMKPNEEFYVASDGKRRSKYNSFMDGVGVFSFAVTDVVISIKDFLDKYNKAVDDYDAIVLHQANNLIMKRIAHKLSIPEEKLLKSLDEYGNTSGVSIPLTISKCYADSNSGIQSILAVGYGIGLSWGITELKIDTDNVLGIIETDAYYDAGIIK